jgi:hypothetical protein
LMKSNRARFSGFSAFWRKNFRNSGHSLIQQIYQLTADVPDRGARDGALAGLRGYLSCPPPARRKLAFSVAAEQVCRSKAKHIRGEKHPREKQHGFCDTEQRCKDACIGLWRLSGIQRGLEAMFTSIAAGR